MVRKIDIADKMDKICIEKNGLNAGTYFFKINDSQTLIGMGKIILE